MPKYTPSPDDIYSTKPCFICGRDVLDENRETCSDECQNQKEMFNNDWEWFQWKEIEKYCDIA